MHVIFAGPSNTETPATESCCHGWFSEWFVAGEPITCKGQSLAIAIRFHKYMLTET